MSSGEEKIRLRSDGELSLQNRGLQEVKKILEELNISYYLSSGTLLGAIREKNFIRWDWDVQCYLVTEESFPRKEEIRDAFLKEGFNLDSYNASYKNLKFVFIKYGARYEITAWWKKGGMRYRAQYSQIPARFFENPATINFLGATYPCMTPPEEYLEHCYGDWKTPKREADKSKYLNPKFYKYPLWMRRIIEMGKSPKYFLRKIAGWWQ